MRLSFGLVFAFLITLSHSAEVTEDNGSTQKLRVTRSLKDALPKDNGAPQSRVINDMRHKLFSLEHSMTAVNSELETVSTKNDKLETALTEQKSILEGLAAQFSKLNTVLQTHGSTLDDLESLANTDQNLFALSNQTCGGVLEAQSGSIVFSSAALRGFTRFPSMCVWTVRANHRAFIKLSTTALSATLSSSYASRFSLNVVEIFKNDTEATVNGTSFQPRLTTLERNMHYVFTGPVIFIVYSLGPQSEDYSSALAVSMHYEALGQLKLKNVFFSHEHLSQNSGTFSDNEMEKWSPRAAAQIFKNSNFTLDITTLVISNFSTKVHLEASLASGQCSRDTAFYVISDLLENTTSIIDCCKNNCTGKNSLVNYDNPFIIIITKKFQQPMHFNLNWVAETPYPSSSSSVAGRYSSVPKCGEVLGGTSGTLSYKASVSYRNSERCIWVIVPQPRPRTTVAISVGANGVESGYDHLYMMELTDAFGNELVDGPKITNLGRYGTYNAGSREIYIVFYSDSSITGNGFSLSWRSSGVPVKTASDVTTRFTILNTMEGDVERIESDNYFTRGFYQVFILTPVVPSAYSYGMLLGVNQTLGNASSDGCLSSEISIFTPVDGIMTKSTVECYENAKTLIKHADGMGIIVMNSRNSSSNIGMNFKWKEELGEGNSTYVVVSNDNCGGVIIGEKGALHYKLGSDYFNNERCVWLLHSPNSTSITLKLVKDGFETCCDYILVNTIDPTDGTLRNDTTPITRANRTLTITDSLAVIVFRTDGSTRGKGFALQFTGTGSITENSPAYTYRLRHRSEPYGVVTFPGSDWEQQRSNGSNNEVLVIAYSLRVGLDEDPQSMTTNISWTGGSMKKANQSCDYDSITFYTSPDRSGWLTRNRFPEANTTLACPEQVDVPAKKGIASTVFSAFVVVYKLVSPRAEDDGRQLSFSYEKSAGCGGIFVGDQGEISYKEDGKYSNGEMCIWLVQVPQASRIRLRLERSGFEECCDVLLVTTIDRETGTPTLESIISRTNRSAVVNGPVIVITFVSDGSVVGDGFRLSFSTEVRTTENFPMTYHLDHRNQPQANEFVYSVHPNQMIVLGFSPETHRSVYYSSNTRINIASFRPQVDESCTSDSLMVYEFYGKSKGFVSSKSYSALNMLQSNQTFMNETADGRCNPLTDGVFTPCDTITQCTDAPPVSSTFRTQNSTSFLAVYRSVNVTSPLKFRGFVLVSSGL